jgi:cell division protein FtsB
VSTHAAAAPRRARLSARGAALLIVVMFLLVAAVNPVRNLLGQRSELARLQQRTSELQVQNNALQHRVDQLNDPAYLERLARECLGMVHAGEIAFRAIPKQGALTPPRC